jgi:hypothetical protein
MTAEAETIFINSIDCKFPYSDRPACLTLINEAAALSINAIFFVVEEICRIPSSDRKNVTTDTLMYLLAQTETKFTHPLKELVLETARKMVKGQSLTADEVISKMEIIKKYKGQYAALNILYFSSRNNWERLIPVMDSITAAWTKNAT